MKSFLQAIRSGSKIEVFLMMVMVCVLLVLLLNTGENSVTDNQEERLEKILSRIEGAGRVSVLIAEEENVACGAVVAAEGADDMHVYLDLLRAVQVFTGLELQSIEIIKSGG